MARSPRWARSATPARSLQTMAAYTAGERQAAHVLLLRLPAAAPSASPMCEKTIRDVRARGAAEAGPAGPFPTTTWCATSPAGPRMARTGSASDASRWPCLLALRGSVCLYQGEELGLTEAEFAFEDLRTPTAIAFWPEFKGRDGCRTPMVWDADKPNAGFSSANRTWLPVAGRPSRRCRNQGPRGEPRNASGALPPLHRLRHAHDALRIGSIRIAECPGRCSGLHRASTAPSDLSAPSTLRSARPVLPCRTGVEARSLAEAASKIGRPRGSFWRQWRAST